MRRLFLSIFLFIIIQKSGSQPWVNVGSDDRTSASIALTGAFTFFTQVSNDGIPYISYIDDLTGGNNLGDFKVHAKRFNNGQWEFAGDAISPSFPESDNFPVAMDGNVPYVAYSEAFTPVDIQNKLTVKRLNSNTGKWEVVGTQGFSDGAATGTAIAADNGRIYVAYEDDAFDDEIIVKFFDNANPNNGWQTVGTPAFSDGLALAINIVIDNGVPYVAYRDFTDNSIFVKKFNGTDWVDVGSNNPSGGATVEVRSLKFNSKHIPFITFVDSANTGFVRNLSAANEWVTTGGEPLATGIENPLSLEILHDIPFVAFGLKENGVTQVHVKRFDSIGNSWTDVGNQPATASASAVNNVILTTDGINKLFVVYRNFNGEIYAKTFDASGVLPVTLTTFNVTQQNNKSLLQWVTASEDGNKLFEIEHSTDAIRFEKIGEVAAKRSPGNQQDYSFIHASPANGINYYRLKQIDKDENFTYSGIISITFNGEQQPVFALFPNPAKNILHAEYAIAGEKEIIIRDTEGKILKRVKTGAESIDVDITDLPHGTLFISLYVDKLINTKSFVK